MQIELQLTAYICIIAISHILYKIFSQVIHENTKRQYLQNFIDMLKKRLWVNLLRCHGAAMGATPGWARRLCRRHGRTGRLDRKT